MRKAIDDYYADKRRWPETVDDLVRSKYLRVVPSDPITGSATTWIPVTKEGAVHDIRSGADGNGRDGTAYRSW
jgi:Bacterial type II secretion system protein G.